MNPIIVQSTNDSIANERHDSVVAQMILKKKSRVILQSIMFSDVQDWEDYWVVMVSDFREPRILSDFEKAVDFMTGKFVVGVLIAFWLWTFICFVVMSVNCRSDYHSANTSYYSSGIVFPTLISTIHLTFSWHWNHYRHQVGIGDTFVSMRLSSLIHVWIQYCREIIRKLEIDSQISPVEFHSNIVSKRNAAMYIGVWLVAWACVLVTRILAVQKGHGLHCEIEYMYSSGSGLNIMVTIALSTCGCFVMFAVLAQCCDVCALVVRIWIFKNKYFRLVKESTIESILCSKDNFEVSNALSVGSIVRNVMTDAHERYLLTLNCVTTFSAFWDAPISLTLVFSLILCVWYVAYVVIFRTQHAFMFMFLIFALIGLLTPLTFITHANFRIQELNKLLFSSKPDIVLGTTSSADFSLLGGRGYWMNVIEALPLYWTVIGIPITPATFQAILVTSVTLTAASLAPLVISSLSS